MVVNQLCDYRILLESRLFITTIAFRQKSLPSDEALFSFSMQDGHQ